MSMTEKPGRSFWQIWNMSFGFLGIQFGWGLWMANMSSIYQFLGADEKAIPIPRRASAAMRRFSRP
jgi:maltose/moltooligosaccharide transporter